jgi:hypothetical protein
MAWTMIVKQASSSASEVNRICLKNSLVRIAVAIMPEIRHIAVGCHLVCNFPELCPIPINNTVATMIGKFFANGLSYGRILPLARFKIGSRNRNYTEAKVSPERVWLPPRAIRRILPSLTDWLK